MDCDSGYIMADCVVRTRLDLCIVAETQIVLEKAYKMI